MGVQYPFIKSSRICRIYIIQLLCIPLIQRIRIKQSAFHIISTIAIRSKHIRLQQLFKNPSSNWQNHTEGISLQKEGLMQSQNENNQPKIAQFIALINQYSFSVNIITSTYSMILDPMSPYCKACSADIVKFILEEYLVSLVK